MKGERTIHDKFCHQIVALAVYWAYDLPLQGFLAFCPADQIKLMETDVAALSALLGKQDYVTSTTPFVADAALFGFLDIVRSLSCALDPIF
jgi:glutathione S-transferase